jgi:hypothetical protein
VLHLFGNFGGYHGLSFPDGRRDGLIDLDVLRGLDRLGVEELRHHVHVGRQLCHHYHHLCSLINQVVILPKECKVVVDGSEGRGRVVPCRNLRVHQFFEFAVYNSERGGGELGLEPIPDVLSLLNTLPFLVEGGSHLENEGPNGLLIVGIVGVRVRFFLAGDDTENSLRHEVGLHLSSPILVVRAREGGERSEKVVGGGRHLYRVLVEQ